MALAGIRLILSLRPGGLARLDEVQARPVGIWLGADVVAPFRSADRARACNHDAAPESETRVSGGRTRRVGQRGDAQNPPGSRGGGIRARDHAARRCRPFDSQLTERAERRSRLQHRAGVVVAACQPGVSDDGAARELLRARARADESCRGCREGRDCQRVLHRRQSRADRHRRGQHASRVGARAISTRRDYCGLFRNRGHPVAQRPGIFRGGWRKRSESGHHQRHDGAPLVAWAGCRWQAIQARPARCEQPLVYRRWGRRRHAPAGAGAGADSTDVRVARTESVAARDAARADIRGSTCA